MKDKSYVVISGALRESIGTMTSGGLIAQPYSYRTGDLGLIHSSIIAFWKNFHKNYFGKGRGFKCFEAADSGGLGVYIHEKEDVPVLIYNGHLLSCGSPPHPQTKREYLIVPLRKNEFSILEGTSLGEVRKGLLELYKERGMKVSCYPINLGGPEKALEKTIQEQWKKLALFNPNKNLIYEIPIESSERDIPKERIESIEQLNKTLNEHEQWRRESLDSKFRFDKGPTLASTFRF